MTQSNQAKQMLNKNQLTLLLGFLLIFSAQELKSQGLRKVLFLGNSYTGANNLPQLVKDVTSSAGDTLVFDSNTPGGYQLVSHAADANSQNKIMAGNWDYVVIQGQSQEPIIASYQFSNGGQTLYNQIKQYNPCAVVMPYMTWGRKNGDANYCPSYPEVCTYRGMDSTLKKRYLDLTNLLNSEVSPVSVVWNHLRQNNPNIELYQADGSHPSAAGSFAAACCFYTSIFKKDPNLISYHFGLNANDAAAIKNAVKIHVYDSLQSWNFKKLPDANFSYQASSVPNQFLFNPINQGIQQNYLWDFGDGNTSNLKNPIHTYVNNGNYTVSLTTTKCDLQGSYSSFSDTTIQFCTHAPSIYISKPWLCNYDTLWTQSADAYQWFSNGVALPETLQYLANYARYNISGFSVLSTVNGCSELSTVFNETAEWNGYFFDALGDPCMGDTVAFAVLHQNGMLSGSEHILWFKNDQPLSFNTNQDTLHISQSGKYTCKVVNPNTICPFDTSSYTIEYDCGQIINTAEISTQPLWSLQPNPAQELLNIRFSKAPNNSQLYLYNALGKLVKVVNNIDVTETTTLNISDLPSGIYFLHLNNSNQSPLKFIKQ